MSAHKGTIGRDGSFSISIWWTFYVRVTKIFMVITVNLQPNLTSDRTVTERTAHTELLGTTMVLHHTNAHFGGSGD